VPAAKTYTQGQKDAALALYETHGPTAVEKQLGIPKGTVTGWAKANGTRTVRTERTRHAVEAAQADNRLRRQNIINRLFGQAEKMLDDLEGETFKTILRGEGGSEGEDVLDFVPTTDRRALIQSINTATNNAVTLEKVDSDGGAEDGVNMLTALAEALGVRDA
jgi:hypothetical protein